MDQVKSCFEIIAKVSKLFLTLKYLQVFNSFHLVMEKAGMLQNYMLPIRIPLSFMSGMY